MGNFLEATSNAFDNKLNPIEGQSNADILLAPSQYSKVMADIKSAIKVAKNNEKSPFKATSFGAEIKTFYNKADLDEHLKNTKEKPSPITATNSEKTEELSKVGKVKSGRIRV